MRINKLILQDFKFFNGRYELDFSGKNVLIYGENGSGKSSIYWALYTFLQSSVKNDNEIKKYFDSANPQNLINRYAENPDPMIGLELIDSEKRTHNYTISFKTINTNKDNDTIIQEANFASDFINYRLLSRMYDFRNSEDIDLFEVFEHDILDYIGLATIENAGKEWQYLRNGLTPRPRRMTHPDYKAFQARMRLFNNELKNYLNELLEETNEFLQNEFDLDIQIFWTYHDATYDDLVEGSTRKRNHKTLPPKIILKAEYNNSARDQDIPKPHTFLNEAKLTAIALSIRLAVLKRRLSATAVKVLVLDDLLISLDMSHRVTVANIILNYFSDFQIVFMTHDRGFYYLLRRIAMNSEWRIFEMYDNGLKPKIKEGVDNLERAKRLLESHEYEGAANFLRKESEEILKYFLDPELKFINKEFRSLKQLLNEAKKKHEQEQTRKLRQLFKKKKITPELAQKLHSDFENDTTLSPQEKGLLRGLKKELFDFTIQAYQDDSFIDSVFEEFKDIKDRVLNPSSHYSEAPIFRKEVENALKTVKHLKEIVQSNIAYRIAYRREHL